MVVLIVDEIDQLHSAGVDGYNVLKHLFLMASKADNRLILIGMGNSLDLIDNKLSKLLEVDAEPERLTFSPYKAENIERIIKSRLSGPHGASFNDKALSLCSKKVASATGDMRTALELCCGAAKIAMEAKSETVENYHMAVATRLLNGSQILHETIRNLSAIDRYVLWLSP